MSFRVAGAALSGNSTENMHVESLLRQFGTTKQVGRPDRKSDRRKMDDYGKDMKIILFSKAVTATSAPIFLQVLPETAWYSGRAASNYSVIHLTIYQPPCM